MKKILISALTMLSFCFSANAQTVISNNYEGSPITSSTETTESDDDESFLPYAVSYYSFDGFENWGIGFQAINPNKFGMEMGIRMNFEEHGNYNIDLGLNYSFKLFSSGETKGFLVLAAGPSFRLQDQYDIEDDEWDTGKFFFDGFATGRINICHKRLTVGAGYYVWGPKFKFGSDYRADGFTLSLGYNF